MRLQTQPAFLLHRRPFRDSSDLLDLLTLDHGCLGAVARGLGRRRSGGSLAALLQPFRPLLVSVAGRGDLLNLAAVESGGSIADLRGDALFSGFYLNELVLRALQRFEPHPSVFLAYGAAVEALGAAGSRRDAALALRRFEFALIDDLGYAIDFGNTIAGAMVETDGSYRLQPGEGLVPVAAGKGAQHAVSGEDLLAIADGRLEAVRPAVLRGVAQRLLADHVGPEPLRSAQVFAAGPRS